MGVSAEIELSLPRDASAPAMARHAVLQALPDDVDARDAGDLELLVCELVTNAVQHGEGDIRMRLRIADGTATGEVVDSGHGFEREVRRSGPDALRGRGLAIVDALSSRWGVHEGTTHVWFEMDFGPRPEGRSGPALGEA